MRQLLTRVMLVLTRVMLGLLALVGGLAEHAHAWPEKPVRIVVGFSPGGSSDLIARLLASEIASRIGGLSSSRTVRVLRRRPPPTTLPSHRRTGTRSM